MHTSGEFRRYADEQESENRLAQRKVQNALRDAAAHIDRLEKRLLEVDAVCCDYEQQRDALQDQVQSITAERTHAVAALSEQVDTVRAERDEARRERDEARRMYCDAVILHGTAHRFDANGVPEEITDAKEFARRLRWDCFKEVTP